ncbi:Uncharacterised protein [Streptococcus pyogenes]|nr:hypothetical protein STAB901_07425 [Streptococcus pyogenes STAB901]SUO68221.1 Uncharacterised protein [Streptococcus pyogenes]VGT59246.1 Uncharacterised protein [Streptococcus pyogenes]VGT60341.1 Uncharacterised protein [Streptococcus pyogenes]VGT80130.1 Uncharacterised protein [Streptococcus pyogenes]
MSLLHIHHNKKDNSPNRAIVSKSFIYLKLYRVTPTV